MTPDELLKQIAELRELAAKATPGPWRQEMSSVCCPNKNHSGYYGGWHDSVAHLDDGEYIENPNAEQDARLIAASRNALPALLDAAEKWAKWATNTEPPADHSPDAGCVPEWITESAEAIALKYTRNDEGHIDTAGVNDISAYARHAKENQ